MPTQAPGISLTQDFLSQQPSGGADLLSLLQETGGQKNDNLTRLLASFGFQGKPIRRIGSSGGLIDPVTGKDLGAGPSGRGAGGLQAFFDNNPNVRSGEFDPTGSKALARGQRQRNIGDNAARVDEINSFRDVNIAKIQGQNAIDQARGNGAFGALQDGQLSGGDQAVIAQNINDPAQRQQFVDNLLQILLSQ